jgi:hypothetical protein
MRTIIRFENNFNNRIHLSLSGRIDIHRETFELDSDTIFDDIVISSSNSYLLIPASNKLLHAETIE